MKLLPSFAPAFAGAVLCTVSSAAFAQGGVPTTPAVVVSATRIPTPALHIGSSVSVLTRQDIEKKNKETVVELLREMPGLAVAQSGGPGQTARVFIRGAESRHTLVLIDGIAVNDPSDPGNAYDFAYLTSDNVERIEVLRGPQTPLYGADAIGGAINIVTRKGVGKPGGSVSVEGGSFATRRVKGESSGELGRFNYSAAASHFETGGISAFSKKRGGVEKDPSSINNFSGRAGVQVLDNLSTSITGRYTKGFSEFDSFGSDTEYRTHSDQYHLRGAANLSLFDGKWQQEAGLSTFHLWRDSRAFSNSKYNTFRNKADWVNHVQVLPDHMLSLGLEAQKEIFESNELARQDTTMRSVFLQDQFNIGDSFYAVVGGRYDKHSTFGGERTYRLAPAYLIHSTGTKLKASVGTGFKAPSLFQLYSPLYGNAALGPEKSRGVDIGFEQRLYGDLITFGSTAFHNDISNLIDFNFSTFRYFNVANATTRGLENFITLRPGDGLTLTLNHTYTLAEDQATKLALLRRPHHRLGFIADKSFAEGKGNVQLSVNHTGARPDIDLAFERARNPSYVTVDFSASYWLSDYVKLYGTIQNAFDRDYDEVYGYGSPDMGMLLGVKTAF